MAAEPSTAIERALQKTQDQLTCGICLELYQQPKLLRCAHVYCEQCLQRIVRGGKEGETIPCPHCRKDTTIPIAGVQGLQGAFYLNGLFEILETLRKNSNVSDHCPKHPQNEVAFYCDQCEQIMCTRCFLPDHQNHKSQVVSDAYDKLEGVIADSFHQMKEQVAELNRAVESVCIRQTAVREQKTAVVTEIRTDMAHLRKAIDTRETELVSQAEQLAQQKLETLEAERNGFEMQLLNLRTSRDLVEGIKSSCSRGEIINMKSPLLKQMSDVIGSFKPKSLVLTEQADMGFTRSLHKLTKDCKRFGKVYCNPPCPEMCQASGEGTKLAMRGQTAAITVEAFDGEGKSCFGHEDSFRCKLVVSNGSSQIRATVKRKDQNIYDISYQPEVTGEHKLNIVVEGQTIPNSPFTVTVLPNFTATAKIIRGFNGPHSIAIGEKDVVVAECIGQRVAILSDQGGRMSFGPQGTGPGQFTNPKGIAIDRRGNILVTDSGSHCIHWFTSTGIRLLTVGEKRSGPLQFKHPVSIKVNPLTQQVYVVEYGNNRIQILDQDLTHSKHFGKEGSGREEFNHPYDLSTDSDGNVYVADGDNHRIQVFTANGVYLRHFGRKGEGEGELDQPNTIAVDNKHNWVYVGEWGNNRISIFSTNGEFIRSFGKQGKGNGQFKDFFLLAVGKSGTLYVSDTNNCRIQIFN